MALIELLKGSKSKSSIDPIKKTEGTIIIKFLVNKARIQDKATAPKDAKIILKNDKKISNNEAISIGTSKSGFNERIPLQIINEKTKTNS